jgi:fumarylacetoacetase
MLDETHEPGRRSWVASANGHSDFPIQNLPLGVFSLADGRRRLGTAIGDEVLDLGVAAEAGLFDAQMADLVLSAGQTLNHIFGQMPPARRALRRAIFALLDQANNYGAHLRPMLYPAASCTMHLPATIGGYTDFFAGIHHATNTGRMFRPDDPLLPNYKYVPVGYHGRTSTIGVSGETVIRPNGQRKPRNETVPTFGPCRNLDYELELGFWIGPGNRQGSAIPIHSAGDNIVGICLLNDWSARDIQAWEYQPLGPFLAKNFATTISPWVVTVEALAPFRKPQPPRPADDPAPLPYLFDVNDQKAGAFDISLEVWLQTVGGAQPHRLSVGSSLALYWTPAQLVAHHASGGCKLEPGDLFGSGTLSGTTHDSFGSLLELSEGGRNPVAIGAGSSRTFLEDGDTVIFRARCYREGFTTIGFGECRGTIAAAL